jgi:hypothetical protein
VTERLRSLAVALIAGLLLAGCSTLSVVSDYDPAFDFSQLRSYAWLQPGPAATGDPRLDGNTLLRDRVHAAVDAELAARGLKRLEDKTAADVLVTYTVTLDRRTSVRTINHAYGYAPWGPPGYHFPGPYALGTDTYVYEYDEGTLIIDLVTPEERRLIWRGSGTDELRLRQTPGENAAAVRETVAAILEGFPPPAGSGR